MKQGSSNGAERTLHLVDVENLTGVPAPTAAQLAHLRAVLASVAPRAADDLVVLGASSCMTALRAGLTWPGTRLAFRRGGDGAELALIEAAEPAFVARRFTTVLIGSGDAIFADYACDLAVRGLHVVVVSRRDALARRLWLAAHQIRFIDPATEPRDMSLEVRRAG